MLNNIDAFPSDIMLTSEVVIAVHDLVSPSLIIVLYIFLSEWIQYCPLRAPSKQATFPEVTYASTQSGSPVSSRRIILPSFPIFIEDDPLLDPGKSFAVDIFIVLYTSWLFDVTIILLLSLSLHEPVKHKVTDVGFSTLLTFMHPALLHVFTLLTLKHVLLWPG